MNHQLHFSTSGFKKHLHLEGGRARSRVFDKHEISLISLELAIQHGNCSVPKSHIPLLRVFLTRGYHNCSNMCTKVLTIATNHIPNHRSFINITSNITFHLIICNPRLRKLKAVSQVYIAN